MHQLDVARIEGLQQHEQPERARALEERLDVGTRQHAQDHQHPARAGGARLEHLVGIDEEVLAHRRHAERRERTRRGAAGAASEPSKRLGSVSTETAAAPARA